jgi:hypothetical protein
MAPAVACSHTIQGESAPSNTFSAGSGGFRPTRGIRDTPSKEAETASKRGSNQVSLGATLARGILPLGKSPDRGEKETRTLLELTGLLTFSFL